MTSNYQKLDNFETTADHRSNKMSGRTPSFIVVGLVIIMFLLGLFYMSCSSKNTELRLSLEQFEERIRALTIKNSDSEKKIENINLRKRELEEEKLTIQKQMEKKDSEVNDLNTKLNEKIQEFNSLKSDKKVLDEQLKDYNSQNEALASKNLLIEKLQLQLNEQKQANNDQLSRLKQEYETVKIKEPLNNEKQEAFPVPPQRFRPFPTNNLSTRSIASLFRDPLNKLNNLTKEVKAQIVPAAIDMKDRVLNVLGVNNNSTTSTLSQEQQANAGQNQQEVGQNVPAPPLANNAQRQLQPDHIESAQAAPQAVDKANQENRVEQVDNAQNQQPVQHLLNNAKADNKENDDEEQLAGNDDRANVNAPEQLARDLPIRSRLHQGNSRRNHREEYRQMRNNIRQKQQFDRGEEVDNNNNEINDEDQEVQKRNL